MVSFVTESVVHSSPARTFALICDVSRWSLFRGLGPIPGIAEASLPCDGPMGLGTRVRVRNTDGSIHHERVVRFDPGRLYEVHMELSPPGSWVMHSIEETVELSPWSGGTRMVRRFTLNPRSFLTAPLVLLLRSLLQRAVEDHNTAVAACLGSSDAEPPRGDTP